MIELDKLPKEAITHQELPVRELILDVSEQFVPVSHGR
jgi:hypothetical protein